MTFYTKTPIAHRGLHNDVLPENSLGSFKNAVEYGYGIEVDLQLTKDGEVVVFHDDDLKRMTGSNGLVGQYTLKSLKSLRLANSSEEIPTLKEFIDLVDGRVPLVIELKCPKHDGRLEDATMKLLKEYGGDYTIQSFNPLTLKYIREKFPFVTLGLLVTSDFSDTKLNFLQKFILEYMFYMPVIRPDYIGLDYSSFGVAQFLMARNLNIGKILFWTIRDEQTYYECQEFCDNVIFENFYPPVDR